MPKLSNIKKLALSAMFLALGIILPIFTMQIKEIGDTLLPMHMPIMLCGLICGAKFGFATGLVLPFMRSLLFSMPPMYPNAVWMSLELATYGLVIALSFKTFKRKNVFALYVSLISSQIAGRLVWGISKTVLLGISGKPFGLEMFLIGGFVDSALGIALQLILVPSIMLLVKNSKKT